MQTQNIPKTEYRQKLMQMLLCYRESRVLMTCVELGVFKALDGKQLSSNELAAILETSERGISTLLNAAVTLGLLEKRNELYSNSDVAHACLAEEGPGYLGHLVKLDSDFYLRWGLLAEAVRKGGRPEGSVRRDDPEWVKIFELAHVDMALERAPVIAEALSLPKDRPLRSIDLGGGHGYYSVALAQCYPNLTAIVFDRPNVVPFARELIAQTGNTSRVSCLSGDFLSDDLGNEYDVALLFGVMGGQSPENRRKLITRTYQALKPGGLAVLHDSALNPERTSPKESALFAVWMLIATDSGGVSTTDDFNGWVQEAGFGPLKFVELAGWPDEPLMIAEKPGK